MKIKILNRTYEVQFVEPNLTDDNNNWGIINYHSGIIQINKKIIPSLQLETIIHELIHDISNQQALKLEENQVDVFTTGIFSMMFDNDWIKIKKQLEEK